MVRATLDAPMTLDPQTAVTLKLRRFTAECDSRVIQITIVMVDDQGKIVGERTIQADGAQVNTWITNQEAVILNRLLAKLGVTGTIA